MFNCRDLATLVKSDRKIGPLRKLEIKLHLLMCRCCRAYSGQMEKIGEGFDRYLEKKLRFYESQIKNIEDSVLSEQLGKQNSSDR